MNHVKWRRVVVPIRRRTARRPSHAKAAVLTVVPESRVEGAITLA